MPQTIVDNEGNESEVYTAEELEEQRNEAVETYKAENPDKTEELDALQADLTTAKEELEKAGKKDLNFAELRKQKEAAEKKVDDITAQIDEKVGQAKKEVLESVMKDHYNETLLGLAGDDEELKKKVEFQFNRLTDIASTKEEITKKLTDAWVLATKPEDNVLNTSVISSGGVSRMNIRSTEPKFSPEEKAIGRKLADAGNLGEVEEFK